MEETAYILALSADFERLEAALVDTAGVILHIEAAPVRITSRGGGEVYIDPARLRNLSVGVIRALLERKPREARRIVGVGLIGRSPSVCVAGEGGVKAPFALGENARGKAACAAMSVNWEELYARVGLTSAHCQVPYSMKVSAEAADGVYLTPKDFLKWTLTGEFSTDALDAQKTFLWDLETGEWSQELCRMLGVERSRLPEVREATAAAGKVSAEAARATGLKEGLPVSCGLGDWGEYLGSGVFEVSDAFEHIGTTAAFYGVTDKRPGVETGLDVRPHVGQGRYLVGREGLPGGTCLEWLVKKSSLARGGEIDWPALDEELDAIAAVGRPENVIFFPNLSGGDGQISQAAFMNMHLEDDLTSLVQGLMEGVFFNLKAVAEELRGLGWLPQAVYTTGQIGFKHGPRRMRAHIYGAPVHAGRMPGANVVAAALVGAVACGAYGTIEEAREGMLNIGGGASPEGEAQALYEAHFAQWIGTRDFLASSRRG